MKLSIFGSIAYDELAHFEGSFREIIAEQDLKNLSVSFVVNDRTRFFGGVGGNVAYGLQLLGAEVVLCGAVGGDAADYLERMKTWTFVDSSNVQILEGNTAMAFISSDLEENQIAHFAPGVIGTAAPPPQVPVSDWLLIAAENKSRMMSAFEVSAKRIFDPGQMVHAFEQEERIHCLEKSDLLMLNSYEWDLLKNEHAHVPNTVLITQGSEGVQLLQNKKMTLFGCDAVQAIDPTGAGDAFRAGFLAGLIQDANIEKCIQLGQKMGRACVQALGTQTYTLEI